MAESGSIRAGHEYLEYSSSERYIILIAIMLGSLMQVIDTSIVNVAIPTMMGNLGATLEEVGWVSTGYIISNVIFLPLTGWLSGRFGRRRYLAYSIVIFTIASLMCGMSRSLNGLIFWRVMQGIGGAALISTAQATLMEIFPPKQVGMMQAIFGIGIMVGPTVGPTLGGWLTDNYSWPWIFFINIPVGILATVLTLLFMHDSKVKQRVVVGIDLVGISLLAIGLGCLQTVLEKGQSEDWFQSSFIVWFTITSVLALVSFVLWELHTPHPVVNLRVLKNRGLAAGSAFAAVIGFGLFGGVFILPVFLQQLRQYTAMQSGWILFPGAMATAVMMLPVGKMVNRFSARSLTAIGAVGFIISNIILATVTIDTGPEHLLLPLVVRGAAMGFMWVPLTMATLMGLHGKDMADGTGLYNVLRQLGGSAGIAYLSTYLTHQTAVHRAALVEQVTRFSGNTSSTYNTLQWVLTMKGSPASVAAQQAHAIVDHKIQAQAAVLGFGDAFMIIAVLFVISMPLLLLFKKGVPQDSHRPQMAE